MSFARATPTTMVTAFTFVTSYFLSSSRTASTIFATTEASCIAQRYGRVD